MTSRHVESRCRNRLSHDDSCRECSVRGSLSCLSFLQPNILFLHIVFQCYLRDHLACLSNFCTRATVERSCHADTAIKSVQGTIPKILRTGNVMRRASGSTIHHFSAKQRRGLQYKWTWPTPNLDIFSKRRQNSYTQIPRRNRTRTGDHQPRERSTMPGTGADQPRDHDIAPCPSTTLTNTTLKSRAICIQKPGQDRTCTGDRQPRNHNIAPSPIDGTNQWPNTRNRTRTRVSRSISTVRAFL